MRILVVGNSYPISRSDWKAPFAMFFVEEIRALGHEVEIVTLERLGITAYPGERGVHRLPAQGCLGADEGIRLSTPANFLAMARLHRRAMETLDGLCRTGRFDIGLSMWVIPAGYWLSLAKRRFGLPFVTWALGSDIKRAGRLPIAGSIVRRTLRAADHRYADGRELCESVTRMCGLPCEYLPTTRTLPAPEPGDDPRLRDRKLFLYVGRLEPVKGPDVLIRAFAATPPGDAILMIIGIGSMEAECRRLIAELDCADRVFLLGWVSTERVAHYLSVAHCCVVPSRYDTLSIVIAEALQHERPVIVSRVGDQGEAVERWGIGLSFPSEDVAALSRTIQEMARREASEFRNGRKGFLASVDTAAAARKFLDRAERILGA